MEKGRSCDVSGACHWAVNAAATASHGKMWGKAYSVCVSGIFVAPDSPYRRPEDLAGVKVGVGYHSGSHYSAIQGARAVPGAHARSSSTSSGCRSTASRLMRDGRVAAANVFGAQYYLLEQLGFRKLVDTTFIMGFLVSEDADREDLERYFRALRRAQREIDLERRALQALLAARDARATSPRASTCAASGPESGSSSSPTRARCSSAPTAGWRAGSCSTRRAVARPAYEDAVLT